MDARILILCGLIFALASGQNEPKKDKKQRKVRGKIVGGVPVEINAVPYQVSLASAGKGHFCGGSIIDAYHILTAAHCVEGMKSSTLTVRSGSTETNKGGVVTPVSAITVHPKYNKRTVDNDIAILTLSRPIPNAHEHKLRKKRKPLKLFEHDIAILKLPCPLTFDNTTKPVKLARSEPSPGSWCLSTGYGVEKESSSTASKYLNYVWTPYVDRETCKRVYSKLNVVTDNMICCGYKEGGRDACQGDSGGPMVVNGELVGVISWGKGCAAAGTPGVYTNVAKYNSWIHSVTRSGSSTPKTTYTETIPSYSYQSYIPQYEPPPFYVSQPSYGSIPTGTKLVIPVIHSYPY